MSRALCLVACFATTLGCGTLYTYSAYSPQLSERLGLSASVVSAIGMVGNFSMSFSGPFAGYVVDTYGFHYPIVISALSTSIGYSALYASYVSSYVNVIVLSMALLLIGIGSTFAFSAAVKCAAVNFPQIRGTATAVTMSGYGLSAFAISLISQLTMSEGQNAATGGAQHMLATLAIVPSILLCAFGPIIIKNRPRKHTRTSSEEYNLGPPPSDSLVDRISERKHLEGDHEGLGLLKSKIFWFYFLMLGLTAGMGQAYIYTCGYMAKSLVAALDPTKPTSPELVAPVQAQQVAILSLANCGGRLISGALSDGLKGSFHLSRTYSIFLSVALCLAAMIVSLHLESVYYLWLPTTLIGLFYGAIFGAYPGIVSDEFGIKRLSSNWGMVALAPIPFSSWLAVRIGKIYDANTDSNGVCVGAHCFQQAYKLHIALTIITLIILLITLQTQSKASKH